MSIGADRIYIGQLWSKPPEKTNSSNGSMGQRTVEKQDSWFSKLGAIVLSILSWIGSVFSLPRAEISSTDREVTNLPPNATYSDSSRSPSTEPPSRKSEAQRPIFTHTKSKSNHEYLADGQRALAEVLTKTTWSDALKYIQAAYKVDSHNQSVIKLFKLITA